MATKIKVGVVRGGRGDEYEISLRSGGAVLRNLPRHIEPYDILITRDGTWHLNGLPKQPTAILNALDVVWNGLHGMYGEDGKIQKVLENHNARYTGSAPLASAIGLNKLLAANMLVGSGIKMPLTEELVPEEDLPAQALALFRRFPMPAVLKPVSSGSSVGVIVVRNFEELVDGLEKSFGRYPSVLIQELIKGREATCGVVDGFRGEEYYALPVIEIIPPFGTGFFDYDAKYGTETQELCPGNFSREEKDEIERLARLAHRTIGARHYSRSDFIVSPRGIYFLEINTLPGLTEESLLPKALAAVGCTMTDFLDHVITLAMTPTSLSLRAS